MYYLLQSPNTTKTNDNSKFRKITFNPFLPRTKFTNTKKFTILKKKRGIKIAHYIPLPFYFTLR